MKRLALCVVVLLAGCGSGGGNVSDAASRALQDDVARVAAAARSGDARSLTTALSGLRAEVAHQRATGGLSATGAATVLSAAGRVAADVPLAQTQTAPSPSASPRPVVRAPTRAPAPRKRKGKGDGKDGGD